MMVPASWQRNMLMLAMASLATRNGTKLSQPTDEDDVGSSWSRLAGVRHPIMSRV